MCALVYLAQLFAWYMGLSGTLLLPADIADAQVHGDSSAWLGYAWYTVYWSTFVLAWLVMPIMNAAWAAGELTWRKRIKAAIRANVLTYIAMAVGGIAAVGYLLVRGIATKDTLSGFLMAWGNTYGLMLIVLLMGHGLVEVPRQLWITSFPERQLQLLYFRATQIDTSLYDAIYDLEDAEKEFEKIQRAHRSGGGDAMTREQAKMSLYIEAIQATRDKFDLSAAGNGRTARPAANNIDSPLPAKKAKKKQLTPVGELVSLHSRLRNGQEKVVAGRQRWEDLMNQVALLELIVSKQLPRPQSVTAGRGSNPLKRFATFVQLKSARALWFWRLHLEHRVLRLTAVLCFVLSAMVIWSEVALAAPVDLSPFGKIIQSFEGKSPLLIQAAALIPFLYMSLCCYRSLFKLRLLSSLALNGPHQSLPGQLMFNAQYLVRLQFPLGYNFLTLLHYEKGMLQHIAFNKLMSNMSVVPLLGTDFNIYAPLIMVVLCLFTACHGYARLLRMVGIEHEDLQCATDKEGQERMDEGKSLIERGKRQAALRESRRQAAQPTAPQVPGFSTSNKPANNYRSYGRVVDDV
ncbi:LMBR1-like membrane protein [Tribonema minus]|uniref:LMBR1-like membrane protein n=1 Tax=Tribonema minus TaxID=303371 RepID=A0A835ZCR5_9STRA|nr:LMBR1-like membrane protein [Tribonema minus]